MMTIFPHCRSHLVSTNHMFPELVFVYWKFVGNFQCFVSRKLRLLTQCSDALREVYHVLSSSLGPDGSRVSLAFVDI